MGAAVVSGLFAVVLACLAWGLKNGSRRARVLSRIERYTQVLKDIPYGHPARAHLDAALAAEAEQLRTLTGSTAPLFPAPRYQDPSFAPAPIPDESRPALDTGPATMDDIFGTGDNRPITPGASPPAQPTTPLAPPPALPGVRSSAPLQAYASVAAGLLAGGFAIFAIWLVIDQLLG